MNAKVTALRVDQITNAAEGAIDLSQPYRVSVTIQGAADLLFHRWNSDAVDAKAKSAKGSKAKKSDDIESYVYRNDADEICMPGDYLRGTIVHAAKFRQDPRSPRKSAMDLFKAGVVSLSPLAPMNGGGVTKWDYEDRRRVLIQRNAITRTRPAFKAGWTVEIVLMVAIPEYIGVDLLREVIEMGGRLVGVGDFRPTYGRFGIVNFKLLND